MSLTTREDVIEMLQQSYCMEIETVTNYLANSINLDGVRAQQIKEALGGDIAEEIGHAEQLGKRIKQLGGRLHGSASLSFGRQPQPPQDTTNVAGVIKGVILMEEAAIEQYHKIIRATHDSDPVTADLCTRLMADEEEHLVLFRGFLKEYEPDGDHHHQDSEQHATAAGLATGNEMNPSLTHILGLS